MTGKTPPRRQNGMCLVRSTSRVVLKDNPAAFLAEATHGIRSRRTKTLRHRYAVFTISTDGVKGFITGQQRMGAVAELHHNVISFLSH